MYLLLACGAVISTGLKHVAFVSIIVVLNHPPVGKSCYVHCCSILP